MLTSWPEQLFRFREAPRGGVSQMLRNPLGFLVPTGRRRESRTRIMVDRNSKAQRHSTSVKQAY
jgi:hypothetical protein